MINTTSFVNAIEKVKHQLRINFDLRTEQMMALSTVASREKDCLCVLPTGYGKSLIYQLLPFVFDELQSEGKCSVMRGKTRHLSISLVIKKHESKFKYFFHNEYVK